MQNETKIIPWEQVPFSHKFMFYKVLTDNTDLCKKLIETLLHIQIDRIERPSGECVIDPAPGAHGIRMDVYVRGSDTVYDLEIQVADTKNLPERTRYYQGVMDETELNAGADYASLKTSYIMFLCLFDLFGKGLPVYTFQNRCDENHDILLGDRTCKMFYNVTGWEQVLDDEERALFQFILDGKARSKLTEALNDDVRKARLSPQARKAYMTWEQSIKEEAQIRAEAMVKDMVEDMAKDMAEGMAKNMAEGMAKNMAEGMAKNMLNDMAKETARRMLSYGDSIEKIADITQLPVAEIQQLQ
ncbi:MAG: Rpn family recombination-promoting nuclease/putative transposase [Treponema sp.]|nr:Rpn family recombination-promoting nuclease/putative transposase [Treponema sp.]